MMTVDDDDDDDRDDDDDDDEHRHNSCNDCNGAGLTVDRGYISAYFVKDPERQICEMVSPRILITDRQVTTMPDLLPILEGLVKTKEPLVIVADDISGEALSSLVVNKLRGVLDVVCIKAPSFGDRRKAYLQDLAAATGATVISEDVGLSLANADMTMLGRAERVVVSKDKTTFATSPDFKRAISERIRLIKAQSKETDSDFEKEKAQERVAMLGGGIARIKVGAATETELKDKKLRYADALNSVKCALEQGVVPGGGACLSHIAHDKEFRESVLKACGKGEEHEDERLGVEALFRSLTSPLKQIAVNAGQDGEVVLHQCINKKFGFGYNAMRNKYEDLVAAGVLDPAKVTINAVQNAASVAALVLTTEVVVADKPVSPHHDHRADGGATPDNF